MKKRVTLSDKSMLSIRSAEKTDVTSILKFIRDLAEYEKLAHEVVATEEILTQSLFGQKSYAEVLLAERNQETVAFAVFFHKFSTFLGKPGIYLEDLFVLPNLRGLGIGKVMLSQLAQIAVERGCERFEWSVLDWNKDAIRFYESLGAEGLSDWTVYRVAGEPLKKLAGST